MKRLRVELGEDGFAACFRTLGFGEAIDSRSRRTEVPWNPTSGGVGCPTSPVSPLLAVPVFAGLLGCVGGSTAWTRETSIGGNTFAVSSSKNLHLRLTSRLLLKGPRIFASDDSGSARGGRIGGCCSCFGVRVDDPQRDRSDPMSAVISGEYTGGRDDSTGGMIGGGSGANGSPRRGWRRLVDRKIKHIGGLTSISSRLSLPFLPYARERTCWYAALFPLFAASSFLNSYENRVLSAIVTQTSRS